MNDVRIRPGRKEDIAELTAIYNHYVVNTHFTFDLEPWNVDARLARWFVQFDSAGPHRLFVAEQHKHFILGYASSTQFKAKAAYSTSVEATIYLRPESAGLGAGRMLYQALFDALSREDVHRMYAGVAQPNDVSLQFHRHMQFEIIGTYHEVGRKFGRYWDVTWLERPNA